MEEILRALRDEGPMRPGDLRRTVQSRLWGPSRFNGALSLARRRGLVRREGGRLTAATGEG